MHRKIENKNLTAQIGATKSYEIQKKEIVKDRSFDKVLHKKRSSSSSTPPNLAPPKEITLRQAKKLAKYAPLIEDAAKRHQVPVELICGIMLQESGGNPNAVSPVGASGLMQLMPATARRFGVKNIFDPAQNINGGTKYVKFLLKEFNGDIELVVAAYNSGEGNVKKHGNRIPPFKETQKYVPAVLGYTQSMINIFMALKPTTEVPPGARRV
ncbi:MAG: lytic transglycosylase domain-containing protein [Pseudomonadota bacterium]